MLLEIAFQHEAGDTVDAEQLQYTQRSTLSTLQ